MAGEPTRFFGSITAAFSLQAGKEMAKSPPCGQSKSCHFDFSWMHNSKWSAKERVSLQLILPITPHHWIKAPGILRSQNGFLAKRRLVTTPWIPRNWSRVPTVWWWFVQHGRRAVIPQGALNPFAPTAVLVSPIHKGIPIKSHRVIWTSKRDFVIASSSILTPVSLSQLLAQEKLASQHHGTETSSQARGLP